MNLPAGCKPRCPGCTHRMLSAAASEAQKMDWLRRILARYRPVVDEGCPLPQPRLSTVLRSSTGIHLRMQPR